MRKRKRRGGKEVGKRRGRGKEEEVRNRRRRRGGEEEGKRRGR